MRRSFASLLLVTLLLARHASAAEARKSQYRGWDSLAMSNGLVEVQVVPDIGGRVMQFRLGDFEFLWVNEDLAGKPPTATGLAPGGGWLNYGGDKLWPAPQGWDNDKQWPGPPDAVLDGSPHTGSIVNGAGASVGVKLVSRKDPRSGIQFSRVIRVADDAAHVSFETTMTNIDTKPRRWGIWQVTQLNALNRQGAGYNKDVRFYSPLNPRSVHPGGYVEMFGQKNNPSFKADAARRMLVAHYEGIVGKAGMDNSAGWVATVDGTAGYVFVERFRFSSRQQYPDKTSATVWLNGAGKFVCGTNEVEQTGAQIVKAHLVESEILGPLVELKPGESSKMRVDWYAAKIGGNFPVLGCTSHGVMVEPLTAVRADGKVHVTGRFGVFRRGVAEVQAGGQKGEAKVSGLPVSPAEAFVLDVTVDPGPKAKWISVVVKDAAGKQAGELARVAIPK